MSVITRALYVLVLSLCLLLPPITATAAPPACNPAAEGTIVYNVAHKLVQFCNGTQWIGLVAKIGGTGDTLSDLSCLNGQIAKWDGANWVCAADDAGTLPSLSSARIWVGNGSNAATAVAMSGDATLSNSGVLTIASNAVGSAEITNASIALADLSATGTASATTYLRGDNTWATIATGDAPTIDGLDSAQFLRSDVADTAAGQISFSQPLIVNNTFATDGSAASGQQNGLYVADLGVTQGTTLNPIYTAAIVGQINAARSIALSVDSSGYIWGFRTHSNAGTYTFNSKTKSADDANNLGGQDGAYYRNASNLNAGTVPTARLGTGTANSSVFLRGDGTWAAPAITESDPQVGTLTASKWCASNAGGTAVDCTQNAPLTTESDPQVGTTTASNFCKANAGGTGIDCATASIASADITDGTITSADIANATIVATTKLSATGTKDATTFLRGDNTWATPSGGGGAAAFQSFTSVGTATWNKPSSGAIAFVECWGGGGSGARQSGTTGGAGGGGGGGYNSGWLPLATLPSSVTVTVGAGGAARTTNGAGNVGGTSSFGAYLSAYGGAGGIGNDGGGGGGSMSAGSGNLPGNPRIVNGHFSSTSAGSSVAYQGQGASLTGVDDQWSIVAQIGFYHGGGGGSYNGSNAGAASFYGGGGGGGRRLSTFGPGGASNLGGNGGGAGANGTNGSQPGGGGGGAQSTSGAGGAGQCNVTVF